MNDELKLVLAAILAEIQSANKLNAEMWAYVKERDELLEHRRSEQNKIGEAQAMYRAVFQSGMPEVMAALEAGDSVNEAVGAGITRALCELTNLKPFDGVAAHPAAQQEAHAQ